MDEGFTTLTDVSNTVEEDAYNGACLKVVCNKRGARNATALEAVSSLPTDSENSQAKPRLSAAKHLPALQFRDEKVVLHPLDATNRIYVPDQPWPPRSELLPE
ncbi:hypothetical protein MRX96_045509 [Rhipicephalus microplus]